MHIYFLNCLHIHIFIYFFTFFLNCLNCFILTHITGGNNVIQNEKTLRKEALDQYLEGGLKESSIIYQVRTT